MLYLRYMYYKHISIYNHPLIYSYFIEIQFTHSLFPLSYSILFIVSCFSQPSHPHLILTILIHTGLSSFHAHVAYYLVSLYCKFQTSIQSYITTIPIHYFHTTHASLLVFHNNINHIIQGLIYSANLLAQHLLRQISSLLNFLG